MFSIKVGPLESYKRCADSLVTVISESLCQCATSAQLCLLQSSKSHC